MTSSLFHNIIGDDLYGKVAVIGGTLLICYIIHCCVRHLQWVKTVEKLPGPPLKDEHFILGHLGDFLNSFNQIPGFPNIPHLDPIFRKYTRNYNAKDHGLFKYWFFNPYTVPFALPAVQILDPYLIQQFLTDKDITKHLIKVKKAYQVSSPLVGGSFLELPDTAAWKHQRKQVATAFHTQLLEDTNQTVVEILNDKLYGIIEEQDGIVDFIPLTLRFTAEVIARVAFDTSFNSFEASNGGKQSLYDSFAAILEEISIRFIDIPITRCLRIREQWNFIQSSRHINSCIMDVIKNRQKSMKNESTDGASSSDNKAPGAKHDILWYMMSSLDKDGDSNTLQTVFSNARMLLFAGHDTTGSTLAYAIWELAADKDCQIKLQQELDDLFGRDKDEKQQPAYKQIMQLKYLNAVVQETLRMHPSAGVGRSTTESVTLKRKDGTVYHIPPDVSVFILPYLVQNDPSLWQDPRKFDPERFLSTNNDSSNDKSGSDSSTTAPNSDSASFTFPFSIGPRSCVGHPLATAELKVTIAHLLYRYNISPAPNRERPVKMIGATNRPHAVHVQFKARYVPT